MIYFSELQGRRVITEDEVDVGRLEDIIFLASETPTITKIIVRGTLEEKLIIPVKYIKRINHHLIVAKEYIMSALEENELYLVKNLLDKQIIDLKGNKIVRVNDVAIQEKAGLYIAGVDIGILAILRWLRLESPLYRFLGMFHIKITSRFLSWGDVQPLELVHGEVKLRKKEGKLQKIRPEDLADYLEKTNITNARKFLNILDEKKAAEVLEHLNLNYRASFFRHYKPEKGARLLALIDPAEAVDILLTLSLKKRQQIFEFLSVAKQKEFNQLTQYSTTQIGGLLTSEFMAVRPDDTIREVIKKIKENTAEFYLLNSVYVINEKDELLGVFNLHELLMQSDLDSPVYKFMIQNVIVAHLTTPAEIVLNKMIKYRLASIPIIDETRHILGIITVLNIAEIFTNKIR